FGKLASFVKINWRHGDVIPASALSSMRLVLTIDKTLSGASRDNTRAPVQIWFEPDGKGPAALAVLHGRVDYTATDVRWALLDDPDLVGRMAITGGRVLIRVHCSNLFDVDGLPVSAST